MLRVLRVYVCVWGGGGRGVGVWRGCGGGARGLMQPCRYSNTDGPWGGEHAASWGRGGQHVASWGRGGQHAASWGRGGQHAASWGRGGQHAASWGRGGQHLASWGRGGQHAASWGRGGQHAASWTGLAGVCGWVLCAEPQAVPWGLVCLVYFWGRGVYRFMTHLPRPAPPRPPRPAPHVFAGPPPPPGVEG